LFEVTWVGNIDIAKLLIAAGADVNAQSIHGDTALMYTSVTGHPEIAKMFIEAGADVNARSNNGSTALMLAIDPVHTEIVQLLLEFGADVILDANFYYNFGQQYSEEGKYDHAILNYAKAIAINPKYVDAYCNRGLAYLYNFQYENAIADFNKALELENLRCNQ